MESPISGFSPPVIAALGWALLHFLWQGCAIAALAAAAMRICRSAQARYLIGLAALVAMLAAPVVTFFCLDGFSSGATPVLPRLASPSPVLLSALVQTWIFGVGIFGLRFAAGVAVLAHGPHRQARVAGVELLAQCHAVQARLGITRVIRYLECNTLTAPAGFGLLRPVILLPAASLIGLSEEQLRAVIAHELAHVRRWDFAINLFQNVVETLLFYHPAIWWLNKRIRAEREICCDEVAVSDCGDRLAYARALVALAEGQGAPSLAMALNHGGLTHRVSRLLVDEPFDARAFAAAMAGSLLLLLLSLSSGNLLLAASHAVSQPVRPSVQRITHYVPETLPAADVILHAPRLIRVAEAIHPRTHLISMPWPKLPPAATPEKDAIVETAPASPEQDMPILMPVTSTRMADRYPAPVLVLLAPHNSFEWERTEAGNYCDKYAQQTVLQGANEPMVVDDAARQRYAFFYWHCMFRNGQFQSFGDDRGPSYPPVGTASSDQPANVAGTWAIAFSPFPAARSCTFTQTGNALAGTCARSEGGGSAQGVVDGRQLRWRWSYLDDEKLPVELDFIGMIGPDGTITGQYITVHETDPRQIQSFTARPGAPITQVASQ